MPIDYSVYPADWPAIRQRILDRAGDRCEECGAPNGAKIRRRIMNTAEWRRYPSQEAWSPDWDRVITVVLTVSHQDHNPANCDPVNLKALCQRCHLAYDQNQHRRNASRTRARKKWDGGLFGDLYPEEI